MDVSGSPVFIEISKGEGFMDVRIYFQKIRRIEAGIALPHTVVVSLDTPDGGKAGVMTEVSRATAAQLVVDGKARLGTEEETSEFYGGRKANTRTPKG
jgi:hypothetical protein